MHLRLQSRIILTRKRILGVLAQSVGVEDICHAPSLWNCETIGIAAHLQDLIQASGKGEVQFITRSTSRPGLLKNKNVITDAEVGLAAVTISLFCHSLL